MRVGTGFCQQKAVEGLGYFCKGKLTELSTRTWVTIDWPKLLLGQSQKGPLSDVPVGDGNTSSPDNSRKGQALNREAPSLRGVVGRSGNVVTPIHPLGASARSKGSRKAT